MEKQRFIWQFLRLLLPLMAILLVVAGYIYSIEVEHERHRLEANETLQISIGKGVIIKDLEGVSADLMVLSQHDTFLRLSNPPTQDNLKYLANEFLTLSRLKRLYDQVRFLDENGIETVRVNFNEGDPVLVSPDQLQDKANRYYFKDSVVLKNGQLFVSPLDLNIENGEVEKPYKPMIRFAAPVFDSEGNKRGVVILNYYGSRLISGFKGAVANIQDHTMLLNNKGYWLSSPNPVLEWGFMLGKDTRFSARFREAWQRIGNSNNGQFYNEEGLFTFDTVYPSRVRFLPGIGATNAYNSGEDAVEENDYYWKVVSHISRKRLNASASKVAERLSGFFVPLFLALFVGSGWLTRILINRQESEASLKAEQAFSNRIIQSMPGLFYIFDHSSARFIRRNTNWTEVTGYSESELDKMTVMDFMVDKDLCATQKQEVHDLGSSTMENELLTRGGERIPYFFTGDRLDIGGKAYLVGLGIDITERKQAEDTLRHIQKMDAVGQLTGGIAHDFNNILAIILGNVELLKDQIPDDEKIQHRIQTINKSAQRAADLTKQLLSFSRRKIEVITKIDVNHLIHEMDNLISRSITPEIEVDYQLVQGLWLTEIDSGNLEDALLNLILNARDAMDGKGRLTIETTNKVLDALYCKTNPSVEPGDYVQIIISDNGEGMSPEQLEHLYEPFYTTKEQGRGTGLGLSMVYGFIERSNGCIDVYSEQGIGTTFKLYLPRLEQTGQEQTASSEQAQLLPQGTETILVVDDEEDLRELARESLQSLGYQVLIASDGQQALKVLAEEAVDLLFSDVVMSGGMNGYELAEQATDYHPKLKVLLTSGYTEKVIQINTHAHFSASLLGKPYALAELAQRIQALLSVPGHKATETIEWTEALTIGIDAIDDDHRMLIDMFNRSQQANEIECGVLLDQIIEFTVTHFEREEVVMAACNYPWIDNHHQVHQLLIAQAEKMGKQLNQGELGVDDLARFLGSWLLDHTQVMDMAFAPYCEGQEDAIEQALAQMDTTPEN